MNTISKTNSFPSLLNDLVNFSFDKVFNEDFQNVAHYKIPTNIVETTDAYILEIAAPGRTKADFAVTVENNLLTVSSSKQNTATTEDKKWVKKEFSITEFKRSFKLNDKIDSTKVNAAYNDGILSITLQKKDEVKVNPLTIEIS